MYTSNDRDQLDAYFTAMSDETNPGTVLALLQNIFEYFSADPDIPQGFLNSDSEFANYATHFTQE